MELDPNRIQAVIARVSDCDAAVARKLADLADSFSYTPILTAIKACENELQSELRVE